MVLPIISHISIRIGPLTHFCITKSAHYNSYLMHIQNKGDLNTQMRQMEDDKQEMGER